jgi:hypothetical protein
LKIGKTFNFQFSNILGGPSNIILLLSIPGCRELINFNLFVCSAYCGGLWLAALRTMSEIAKVLSYPEDIKKYNNILQRGKKAYERKLWNGK